MLRSAALLFGVGATVGSLLDALHTHSGTTSYPRPVFMKMAWWTPGLFGFAGVATGLAYPIVERALGRAITREVSPRDAFLGFAGFAGLYAATGFLPASNRTKLAVVSVGALALGAVLAPTREAAVLAGIAAIVGPAIESFLVSREAFVHHQPDFLGVPMWLPALYVSGSIAFGTVGKWVVATMEAPAAE